MKKKLTKTQKRVIRATYRKFFAEVEAAVTRKGKKDKPKKKLPKPL